MNALPDSRPALERWLALVVRYWAANMTLIHNRGQSWPGFGYTDTEKAEMRSISEKFPGREYFAWVGIAAVAAIAFFGVIMFAGFSCLTYATGGEQNMANTPDSLLYLAFGLMLVTCFTIGFPAAMLLSAALAGWLFRVKDPDLPDGATTARYCYKLWLQISRMSAVMIVILLPVWIFVPNDSKLWVTARLVVPLLSPVVLVLTAAYYFSARLPRSAGNTRRGGG
ncbi:MAG: hypothetical protein ABSF62_10820 [Bryobacteraceae bacterium]